VHCPAYVKNCPAHSTEVVTSVIASTTVCSIDGGEYAVSGGSTTIINSLLTVLQKPTPASWGAEYVDAKATVKSSYDVKPAANGKPKGDIKPAVSDFEYPICIPTTKKVYVTVTVQPTHALYARAGPTAGFPDFTYPLKGPKTTITKTSNTIKSTRTPLPEGTSTTVHYYKAVVTETPPPAAYGITTLVLEPLSTLTTTSQTYINATLALVTSTWTYSTTSVITPISGTATLTETRAECTGTTTTVSLETPTLTATSISTKTEVSTSTPYYGIRTVTEEKLWSTSWTTKFARTTSVTSTIVSTVTASCSPYVHHDW
jgi:hypothetical protein